MTQPTPTLIQMKNSAKLMQIELNMLQAELSSDCPDDDKIYGKLKKIEFLSGYAIKLTLKHIDATPDLLGMLTDSNPALCQPKQ